jgi:hypothetical protein
MGIKQKQTQIRQKSYFEQQLKDRLSFLSGKGIEAARADKDPIVKKIKAGLRAVNNRLRLIAAHGKRTEEMAKVKAEKAAAAKLEKEGGKSEKKAKKTPEEPKAKKPKPEKKAGAPKEKGGEKAPKPAAESPLPEAAKPDASKPQAPKEAPKEEKPQ